MDKQLSKKEAKAIYEAKEWENWDHEEIVKLQLFQDRFCIPFNVFHKAMEVVLERSIWTHEFANVDNLRREYLGMRPQPTNE